MQLDSFLRLFAAWLVEDPHDYATKVLSGIKVSNIKDKDGNKLTDNYLAKTLSKQYSWCPRVYEETSGYIHLSKKHFFNTIADVQEKDRSFTTVLGTNDSFLPDEIYVEAVEAMTEISKGIIRYLHGWMHTKSTVNVATHYVEKKVGQKHE